MSNDPYKLARMAGYYNGVQSAGAAISFGMDAVRVSNSAQLISFSGLTRNQTPYLTEQLVSWALLLVSLPLCGYVLYKTQESSYEIETAYHVENMKDSELHGAALPSGHHAEHLRNADSKVEGGQMDQLSDEDVKAGGNTEQIVLEA